MAFLVASCGGLIACATDPSGDHDLGSGDGKADGKGLSLTFSMEGFGWFPPGSPQTVDASAYMWPGRTVHVFVQSVSDPAQRAYKGGVIDSMGGFSLVFADALQVGEEYRVLAYSEPPGLNPMNVQFGCQGVEWIRTWQVGPVTASEQLAVTPAASGASDPAADALLCNELVGDPVQRFDLRLTGDGFLAQNQSANLSVTFLPQTEDPIPSSDLVDLRGVAPAVGPIGGPGTIRFTSHDALAEGRRERILMYLEADGLPGCTPGDFYGVPTIGPVTGDAELVFTPTSFPNSGDLSADLELCSKVFVDPAKPMGDYASTYNGTGFTALAGKPVRMVTFYWPNTVSPRVVDSVVAADGSFSITMPEAAPTFTVLQQALLIDADGDGRCASPADALVMWSSAFARRDQVFEINPSLPQVNPAMFPREQFWDQIAGTTPPP
ncbi:MAG: hypothetical protein AB7P03_18975 [Kofleriaceae bacterium]